MELSPPSDGDRLSRILALERLEIDRREQEMRAEQDRRRRDRGVGYLFYVGRVHRRLTQAALAQRMGTSRAAITRWELGQQLPSLSTLEKVAIETDTEIVLGLMDPADPDR